MMDRFVFLFGLVRQTRPAMIAFVQFGGGTFGNGPEPSDPEQCFAAAIARTLHLEQPELRVRVIDLAASLEAGAIAGLVLKSLSGTEAFLAVGYDSQGTRRVPRARLQQPAVYPRRAIEWTDRDVIVITGGGKGITAECALPGPNHRGTPGAGWKVSVSCRCGESSG